MNDLDQWLETNARQLSAALENLRERLETFAQASSDPKGATRNTQYAIEPPPALANLAHRFGLTPFEQNILLLCAGMELDTRMPGLCARAQDDPQRTYPTFALAMTLFEEAAWEAISPAAPLRYFRLIDVLQTGAHPLVASPLRADERIVSYLKGLNQLDDRLAPYLAPLELEPDRVELALSQEEQVETILRRWKAAGSSGRLPIVELLGADAESKQLVAWQAAARVGRRLHRLPVELFPSSPAEIEALARLWQRESLLLPLALYLDAQDLDGPGAEGLKALSHFLNRCDGVFFAALREPFPHLGGRPILFDARKPSAPEQQTAWQAAIGDGAGECPAWLAGQFDLNLPSIRRIALDARTETASAPDGLPAAAWECCRAQERPRLDSLAQRLEPKVTWSDIVLPEAEMKLIRQIAAQVRHRRKVYGEWGFERKLSRGLGISALFAGDSGTGKTMAAEVLANDLRLNLYRIDLSAVVSKYIGETEKNLRRLFDAAEEGGAILFFDEADALFGKRSEVKDSHDRYANIEINYLLQRIESYRGLAILATNMKSALDTAFMRRLRFIVNFPFPGLEERRRIWRRIFPRFETESGPAGAPVCGLDYDRLARFNLSGGNIQSIALNAAFAAADAGVGITMPLVLEAVRAEFVKLDRPVNGADFEWPDQNGRHALRAPPLNGVRSSRGEEVAR